MYSNHGIDQHYTQGHDSLRQPLPQHKSSAIQEFSPGLLSVPVRPLNLSKERPLPLATDLALARFPHCLQSSLAPLLAAALMSQTFPHLLPASWSFAFCSNLSQTCKPVWSPPCSPSASPLLRFSRMTEIRDLTES